MFSVFLLHIPSKAVVKAELSSTGCFSPPKQQRLAADLVYVAKD